MEIWNPNTLINGCSIDDSKSYLHDDWRLVTDDHGFRTVLCTYQKENNLTNYREAFVMLQVTSQGISERRKSEVSDEVLQRYRATLSNGP